MSNTLKTSNKIQNSNKNNRSFYSFEQFVNVKSKLLLSKEEKRDNTNQVFEKRGEVNLIEEFS